MGFVMKSVCSLAQGPDYPVSDVQLGDLFDDIWDNFELAMFDNVDAALRDTDVTTLHVVSILALIRFTYSRRDDLPHWKRFLDAGRFELKARGMDADNLLRGL